MDNFGPLPHLVSTRKKELLIRCVLIKINSMLVRAAPCMSRKGPVVVKGMVDFEEDLIQDVNPH